MPTIAGKARYDFMSAGGSIGSGANWESPSRQYFVSLAAGLASLAEAVEKIELAVAAPPPAPATTATAQMATATMFKRQ
jgi:hypothetical protein